MSIQENKSTPSISNGEFLFLFVSSVLAFVILQWPGQQPMANQVMDTFVYTVMFSMIGWVAGCLIRRYDREDFYDSRQGSLVRWASRMLALYVLLPFICYLIASQLNFLYPHWIVFSCVWTVYVAKQVNLRR